MRQNVQKPKRSERTRDMKTNAIIKLISITFLFILVSSSGIDLQAQTKRSRPVKRVQYEEVRDDYSMFPDFFTGQGYGGYGVGVRYMPCQGKELQLTLIETVSGRTEVILRTPVKDSLREQFKAYMTHHPDDQYEQVV